MDNLFKTTQKDKIFEKLIKDLQPITRKSNWKDFGTASKAKEATNHTIEFDYQGYECKVTLK